MNQIDEKYPEGHFVSMWMGIGIAIFSGIGIPLSIITDNPGFIGIGPAIGVAFGLSIGQGIENRYKLEGKIRPITDTEKKRKKSVVTLGIISIFIGIILVLILFLKNM